MDETTEGSGCVLYLPSADPDTAFLAGLIYGARYEGRIHEGKSASDNFGILDDLALYAPGQPRPGAALPPASTSIPVFRTASGVLRWFRMIDIGYEEAGDGVRGLPSGGVAWCDLYVEAEPTPNPPTSVRWVASAPGDWIVTGASEEWTPDRDSLPGNAPMFTTTTYLFTDGAVYLGALWQFTDQDRVTEVDWPVGVRLNW